MYPRAILNDWDKKIMEFLNFLNNANGKVTKKELCSHLSLTRPTLLKLVEDVQSIFNQKSGFQLIVGTNDYELDYAINKQIRTIYEFLAPYSRKYQILRELFEKGSINRNVFVDSHGMSLTTYYSEIKELNLLLQEFDLEIKNNQLRGREGQIRFFYKSILSFLHSYQELEVISGRFITNGFIAEIQKRFGIQVSKDFIHDLGLFLVVTKKRYGLDMGTEACVEYLACRYSDPNTEAFIEELKQSSVFADLAALIQRFIPQLEFLSLKEEQIKLLLFFMTHPFTSTNSQLFYELKAIEERTDFCSGQILARYLELIEVPYDPSDPTIYNVTKSIWRHLFLKGIVEIDLGPLQNSYREQLALMGGEEQFDRALQQLFLEFPGLSYGGESDRQLMGDLGRAYLYLAQKQERSIKVGLYFTGNQLMARQLMDNYHFELQKYPNIQVASWCEEERYDLTITNYFSQELEGNSEGVFFTDGLDPGKTLKKIMRYLHLHDLEKKPLSN